MAEADDHAEVPKYVPFKRGKRMEKEPAWKLRRLESLSLSECGVER